MKSLPLALAVRGSARSGHTARLVLDGRAAVSGPSPARPASRPLPGPTSSCGPRWSTGAGGLPTGSRPRRSWCRSRATPSSRAIWSRPRTRSPVCSAARGPTGKGAAGAGQERGQEAASVGPAEPSASPAAPFASICFSISAISATFASIWAGASSGASLRFCATTSAPISWHRSLIFFCRRTSSIFSLPTAVACLA